MLREVSRVREGLSLERCKCVLEGTCSMQVWWNTTIKGLEVADKGNPGLFVHGRMCVRAVMLGDDEHGWSKDTLQLCSLEPPNSIHSRSVGHTRLRLDLLVDRQSRRQ
jgi:hypothetical protein